MNKCVKCQRKINMGENVLGVHQEVLGPRGFVPLEKIEIYCSEECVKDNFKDMELPMEEERIP